MNVLFVNTGQKLRETFEPYLENGSVYSINNPKKALRAVTENRIDVVILDEQIDSGSADMLLEEIDYTVAIIMVTIKNKKLSFQDPGFNKIVHKPTPSEFVALIHSFKKPTA